MRNLIMLVFALSAATAYCGAVPQKLNILLVDVGTIDTVAKTEKYFAAVDKTLTDAPPAPTPSDAVVDPELQRQAARINWETGQVEYFKKKAEIDVENARRRKVLEGLRNSMVGNENNRLVVIAKDYLASGLQDYGECISVVDRSDASLSELEKAIANRSQEEVAPATLFLSVTMGDLQHVVQNLQVGDTRVSQHKYSRRATAKVSDFNNVRVFSCDVMAESSRRDVDVAATSGENSVIADDLVVDAMKKISAKVGAFLVKSYSVMVVIPKNAQDEIVPEAIELEIDGVPISVGEPFAGLAINHVVTAKLDDEKYEVRPASIKLSSKKTKAVFTVRAKNQSKE